MTGYRYDDERARARDRMAAKRQASRDLVIPAIANPRRRRMAERDPELWLRTYLERIFFDPFSRNQKRVLQVVLDAADLGGKRGIAMERGGGKSAIIKGCTTNLVVRGRAHYPLIIAATAPDADNRRNELQSYWENPDKYPLLAADYPEISVPVLALGGTSKRAETQTVGGQRTFIEWSASRMVFPCVAGSKASGAIVDAVGIEGSIRGKVFADLRPDWIIIDDVETKQTLRSRLETDRIDDTINTDIAGLEGPRGGSATVFICTIGKKNCVADRYTDQAVKPTWHGERLRMLIQMPNRMDMWERYIELVKEGAARGDISYSEAHEYYLAHREEMDAAAIVNNEFRYNSKSRPDGTPMQVSAVEFCFHFIAEHGWDAFNCEYQSDPPTETAPESIQLTKPGITSRLSRVPPRECPPDTDSLVAGIDIGGKAIHYTILAVQAGRLLVVDYGVHRVLSPLSGRLAGPNATPQNIKATSAAILEALVELKQVLSDTVVRPDTGEIMPLQCVAIDSGYQATRKGRDVMLEKPVFEFVRTLGDGGIWRAIKGYGAARYRAPDRGGHGKQVGEHWHRTPIPAAKIHLYHLDSDYYKLAVHTGLDLPVDEPGAVLLPGDDPGRHYDFAEHLLAEQYVTTWTPDKGSVSQWVRHSKANHWLDSTAYAVAAAEMLGLRIATITPAPDNEPDHPPKVAAVSRTEKPKPTIRRRVGRVGADW